MGAGPNDKILFVWDTFIRTDRFGSLMENGATGGAHLDWYLFSMFLFKYKILMLKGQSEICVVVPSGDKKRIPFSRARTIF